MATVVDNFTFARKGRPAKTYPSEWLDGNVWALEQGVDFETSTNSFRTAIAKAAAEQGMKIRGSVDNDEGVVHIQAYPPAPVDPDAPVKERKPRKTKAEKAAEAEAAAAAPAE